MASIITTTKTKPKNPIMLVNTHIVEIIMLTPNEGELGGKQKGLKTILIIYNKSLNMFVRKAHKAHTSD